MVTPEVETSQLAKTLGIPRLFFKREDLHPYGSHKGRSIPYMIDSKVADGYLNFAISGSGNASLAALRHIQKLNREGKELSLTILTGRHMDKTKKERLVSEVTDPRISIEEHERPLQTLMKLIKTGSSTASLRQSTDESALAGYQPLAFEIAGTPDISTIFVGTSSGTTALALANYMNEHEKSVAIHIVQTAGNSPIAEAFDDEEYEGDTIADAIVDRVAHRKGSLIEAIEKTKGAGWIVDDSYIKKAIELLKGENISVTGNGALGLAGLLKALDRGRKFEGSVVCIITGR